LRSLPTCRLPASDATAAATATAISTTTAAERSEG
jgi:hypothetical protein